MAKKDEKSSGVAPAVESELQAPVIDEASTTTVANPDEVAGRRDVFTGSDEPGEHVDAE